MKTKTKTPRESFWAPRYTGNKPGGCQLKAPVPTQSPQEGRFPSARTVPMALLCRKPPVNLSGSRSPLPIT